MGVAVLLAAALVVSSAQFSKAATTTPDVDGVLQAMAQNYCLKGKPLPSMPELSSNVATLGDTRFLRDKLLIIFGDSAVVDQFFRLNTLGAALPKHLDYSCFSLDMSKKAQHEWALTIPVFSKTGDTAFVYLENVCPICGGHGEVDVLKRVSERWQVIHVFQMWVS